MGVVVPALPLLRKAAARPSPPTWSLLLKSSSVVGSDGTRSKQLSRSHPLAQPRLPLFVNAEAAPYAARRVSTRPAAPLFRATHRLLTGSTGADRCAGGSESQLGCRRLHRASFAGVVARSGGVRPASSGGRKFQI